jgi:serine/threonine protein kinase
VSDKKPRPTEPKTQPSPPRTPPELDDPRIVEALEEYMLAVEAGDRPNRQSFLARHGEIAEILAGCLDGMEALHVAASSSVHSASGGALPASPAGGWQPGTPLGDFRILREVGRGGMGVVYEAEQLSLGRRIALKVLPFAFTLDTRQLQRFKNEARAASQLHHNNIVPIYSVGCERGVHFYAMQYIEGQTLAEVIQDLRRVAAKEKASPSPARTRAGRRTSAGEPTERRRPRAESTGPYVGARSGKNAPAGLAGSAAAADTAGGPVGALATSYSAGGPGFFRAVAKLGVQAAEALEHAHAYGVVHRDIKPGNLLVDPHGHLWITDFGLAQFQSDTALTQTGDLLGTLRYMSPEQAMAKRGLVDHRTDIYSLGVTLYELLTREPPYDGRDREELLRQIAFDDPRAPRRWNPQIPGDLETIVLKAMAKRVEDRYATAQELAEDLRRFLEDKPILARRPTPLERLAKLARRHKGVAVAAVALLLLAAVGFGVSTWLVAREQLNTQAALERERQQRARAEKSFQQARETVDLLAQVGEEELADNPFLLSLRRRLLEAALVYYQSFVDERQDDPSSQTELAAARERVAALLGELTASEECGQVMFLTSLLRSQDVQKHLNFTEDQTKKAYKLAERLGQTFWKSFNSFRQLSPQERQKQFQEMTQTARKALAALLTSDQVKRLVQISLQQRGTQALSDPEVARALGLTDEQKRKIRTIQNEACKAMPGPPWGGGRPPPKGRGGKKPFDQRKPPDPWKVTTERVLSVLTPEQRALWDEMKGEPFKGKIFRFGFGGFFGPGPGPRQPHVH